ncbi:MULTISPECIES: response regulator transcription factor [Chitinophaga]|jgi:DNA-binding NarL/FixJ family response regulator|uniref:DNA-binding response regulator, NarL/FixJ family, contains REC and HTH domains n=2 Tax=Chitinophaga TaxID=79328 RepID=A0A1G7VCK6_CHIFI|nr:MULTISPECIES: response regulator transcription factor [Chitinophaga]PSL25480.1 LuxR family two component transcriptional regulator [Chitinophaga ginsengisoli]SDG57291.1 DNA-binding response regulator, NarL/FixJ family, contains REC and HTH domains [Chitinophaga filiformis]SHM02131.1 two component transcriptional regulator, LuxR family [Chitinophaga sp. CF418]
MSITRKAKYSVAIADDHVLVRKALGRLINTFTDYFILFEASNGEEVIKIINNRELQLPDILILDVNMPGMNGYETATWINNHFPQIKVLALSMLNDESVIIKMLKSGAKGYIMKNVEPDDLKEAFDSIIKKDFYLPDYISGKVISGLQRDVLSLSEKIELTPKEKTFLQFLCTELSYKEIAQKMFVSPRTIDDYKSSLCDKLKVKTRVGLVIFGIRYGLIDINTD